MTKTLIRGRLLTFKQAPMSLTDTESYTYEHDGGLLIEDGIIAAIGDYAEIKAQAPDDVTEIDHRPHLILPGL
ncbi:MAG TPA: guanine deaminase, partial [Tianweitania sediminis]|nr:guanine deaminase [Tianweitania sediminis]